MRNVVLITIDSLRADHCGFMGHGSDITPTLDRMARDGLIFENAVAPSSRTPESMPVIFTGEYPTVPNRDENLTSHGERTRKHMKAGYTIAERFSRAGYTTGGFTPNGYTSRYFGFDTGFDHFQDFLDEESRLGPDVPLPNTIKGAMKMLRHEEKFKPWEHFYDRIIEWSHTAEEPYFLWVMLMDTHSPYLVPAEYRSKNSWWDMFSSNLRYWLNGFNLDSSDQHEKLHLSYEDSIRYIDTFLDRLGSDLRTTDPTYVVTADHGEGFGEHGYYGHGGQLYEEYVHVPLVVANANYNDSIRDPISLRNLPTILDALRQGIEVKSNQGIPEMVVISRLENTQKIMARWKNWKLIQHDDRTNELFNLKSDPNERHNVRKEHPDVEGTLQHYTYKHRQAEMEKQIIREHSLVGGI